MCNSCKQNEIDKIVKHLETLEYEEVKLLRLNLVDAINKKEEEVTHYNGGTF